MASSSTTAANRRARLLTAPVVPTLINLAAPNVLLALMQALVSVADAWFIGKLGTESLAGVALVFPLVILMQMMSAGAMGGGVASAIARALGAGDTARAERLALHAVVIAMVFGLGVRLELLQIPVVFAIGPALVVMTGTAIGAGNVARARHVAWSGAALAAGVTGSVGLIVAIWPALWAARFSADAAVLDAAYTYLRIAGPCYAFLGAGVAMYFASQGAGKMLWPVLAGSLRFLIAVTGGWLVLHVFNSTLSALFAVVGLAMAVYGLAMAATVK